MADFLAKAAKLRLFCNESLFDALFFPYCPVIPTAPRRDAALVGK